MTAPDLDVLVVGGGPAGLAFALLMQRDRKLSIGVVEAGPEPAPVNKDIGLRVVAVSPASRAILDACGAWTELPGERIGPYRRIVVWHGSFSIAFDAAEEGVAELGRIVESDLIRAELWKRAKATPGIEILAGVAPETLVQERDYVVLKLADGRALRARLVVGADGQDSWLRNALGIAFTGHEYRQHAIVAHIRSERPHQETAWQRFLPGGPLALLPLADGCSSIVWSCRDERAQELMGLDETEFNRELTEASASVLGNLELTTRRLSFPLASGHAAHYTGLRFALIGDAAHRIHPLAGQGINLGFLDAAVLAETLADHLSYRDADPGDPLALRRFERRRKGGNLAALGAMDALHGLFTSRVPGVSRFAGVGMGLVDRFAPLKSRFADYAMGTRGDVPRVVRSSGLR